jgi:hypothetical protein
MSVAGVDAILDTARALWREQNNLDHDLVDGNFYWRHCRWQIIQELIDAPVRGKAQSSKPLSLEDYARIASHFHRVEAEDPAVIPWLDRARPPRMRDALTSWTTSKRLTLPYFHAGFRKEAGTGNWMFVGVRNSGWTGRDLERVCREEEAAFLQSDRNRHWIEQARDARPENQSFVGIDFTLYNAGQFSMRSTFHEIDPEEGHQTRWIAVESPVLMCTISYPFPPEGVLATLYDSVAREQHRWHERLYGFAAEDQRISTSIRTWTIGLLVAGGMTFRDAQRKVEDHLGVTISQPGFQQDRATLIRRVPEAGGYLYQKRRRGA